jgi:hypothetical protein
VAWRDVYQQIVGEPLADALQLLADQPDMLAVNECLPGLDDVPAIPHEAVKAGLASLTLFR